VILKIPQTSFKEDHVLLICSVNPDPWFRTSGLPVTQPVMTNTVLTMQKDDPEEDMDTRGGGQAAEDRRIVEEEDYGAV